MHLRKKHPYFDWMGFPSGKAKFGNNLANEVLRELEEETGLVGKNPQLKLIQHSLVKIKSTGERSKIKFFIIFS
jgi:ADP-ribose pyrophosphatase YjhB (NUDIX family)